MQLQIVDEICIQDDSKMTRKGKERMSIKGIAMLGRWKLDCDACNVRQNLIDIRMVRMKLKFWSPNKIL